MTDETAWFAWRRTGLGGSDMARADTGLYGGPYAVPAEKQGRLTSNIDPADAERGKAWELAIADAVRDLTGYYVHAEQYWITSPENPRWLATIDGLLDHRPDIDSIDDAEAVLEVKTSRQYVSPKWDYYYSQVQWQMLVCGKPRALIAVAIIGMDPDGNEGVRDLKLRWIERDDDKIADLIKLAERLWAHVEAGTLPDPDEATRLEDVREVWREAEPGAVITLDDDLMSMYVDDLVAFKKKIKQYSDRVTYLEAQLRHAIGEATEAVTSDGRWRVRVGQPVQRFTDRSEEAALLLHPDYARTVLDRARFKADHPERYEELKVPTTDRRLTIKEFSE